MFTNQCLCWCQTAYLSSPDLPLQVLQCCCRSLDALTDGLQLCLQLLAVALGSRHSCLCLHPVNSKEQRSVVSTCSNWGGEDRKGAAFWC